jgi:hypothetical protein
MKKRISPHKVWQYRKANTNVSLLVKQRSRMFAWVSVIRVGSRTSWSNIEFLLISRSWLHSDLWDDLKRISPHKVWQYRKANYDQLREELHPYQHEFNKLNVSTSTDDMWLAFKTKLTTLMKMYIPQKTDLLMFHCWWKRGLGCLLEFLLYVLVLGQADLTLSFC